VPERPVLKGKRKLADTSDSAEEAKKVKLMELADSDVTYEPPPTQPTPTPGPSTRPLPRHSPATPRKKSLLGLLLKEGGEIDVGEGFGLFD
jgi:hypothetical protein